MISAVQAITVFTYTLWNTPLNTKYKSRNISRSNHLSAFPKTVGPPDNRSLEHQINGAQYHWSNISMEHQINSTILLWSNRSTEHYINRSLDSYSIRSLEYQSTGTLDFQSMLSGALYHWSTRTLECQIHRQIPPGAQAPQNTRSPLTFDLSE